MCLRLNLEDMLELLQSMPQVYQVQKIARSYSICCATIFIETSGRAVFSRQTLPREGVRSRNCRAPQTWPRQREDPPRARATKVTAELLLPVLVP